MIDISLIPPLPHLRYFLPMCRIHLALFHIISDDPVARTAYRQRSRAGDRVILDNGAHEGSQTWRLPALLAIASDIEADELVMPDVSLDTDATIDATDAGYKYLSSTEGMQQYENAGRPDLMIVPQGRTLDTWGYCLRAQLRAHRAVFGNNPVIGLAKNHDDVLPGGIPSMIEHIDTSQGIAGNYEFHMLGWPTDLFTLQDIAREHRGRVRSVDSAKPFVYGMAGIELDPLTPLPKYPGREPDYFRRAIDGLEFPKIIANIDVFRAMADARA